MSDPAIKLARAIHKLCNADLEFEGKSYPCHHTAFESDNPLYTIGHAKKNTLASTVTIPLYDKKGVPYDLELKLKVGKTAKCVSRYRASLSHRVRVATVAQDEASLMFTVTDIRR